MFGLFPLFDETLCHIELCNSVISHTQYSEIRQNFSNSVAGQFLLFPELGEDSAAELHPLEGLLGYLHLAVDDVQAALDLLQLLWAIGGKQRVSLDMTHAQ